MRKISIDHEKCILCGQCISVCTRGNIELGQESADIKDPDRCILCGHCKSVCPEDAPQLHLLDSSEFEPLLDSAQMPKPDALLSLFRSRRSIRFYKKEPVSKALLEQMVQAGRFAPTGGNRQPVRYLIIQTPDMISTVRDMTHSFLTGEAQTILAASEKHKEKGEPIPTRLKVRLGYAPLWKTMGKIYGKGKDLLFYHAPAVVVLHADPEMTSPFCADVGLAAMQMVLMAQSLGLGTCFCGFLTVTLNSNPELKKVLQIPDKNCAVLSFVVGHPDVSYLRTVSRRPAEINYL